MASPSADEDSTRREVTDGTADDHPGHVLGKALDMSSFGSSRKTWMEKAWA
jgi:hypothetical protein